MRGPVGLPTGAEIRIANDTAPLAVVLVNGGSARAVPGTWSATSELLTTELAQLQSSARPVPADEVREVLRDLSGDHDASSLLREALKALGARRA